MMILREVAGLMMLKKSTTVTETAKKVSKGTDERFRTDRDILGPEMDEMIESTAGRLLPQVYMAGRTR